MIGKGDDNPWSSEKVVYQVGKIMYWVMWTRDTS